MLRVELRYRSGKVLNPRGCFTAAGVLWMLRPPIGALALLAPRQPVISRMSSGLGRTNTHTVWI
jgi:hypothetical protein